MVVRSKLLNLSRCTVDVLRVLDSGASVATARKAAACTAPGVIPRAQTRYDVGSVAAGAAAAAFAAAVLATGAVASCDGETPLHRMQLDALKQWLKASGSDVSTITFESAEVRISVLFTPLSNPIPTSASTLGQTRAATRLASVKASWFCPASGGPALNS